MHEPDEWLMKQVAAENPRCMEPLVRRYASSLLTFIARLAGSLHRDDEIFQEVFLAVWRHRATYRYPSLFRPWLFKIALNKCHETLRQHRLVLADFSQEDALPNSLARTPVPPAPADTAVGTETATLVEAAVAGLPEKQRLVVVMRIWNGLLYAEIGEALGTREVTVRGHMHEALRNLRRQLEPRLR